MARAGLLPVQLLSPWLLCWGRLELAHRALLALGPPGPAQPGQLPCAGGSLGAQGREQLGARGQRQSCGEASVEAGTARFLAHIWRAGVRAAGAAGGCSWREPCPLPGTLERGGSRGKGARLHQELRGPSTHRTHAAQGSASTASVLHTGLSTAAQGLSPHCISASQGLSLHCTRIAQGSAPTVSVLHRA